MSKENNANSAELQRQHREQVISKLAMITCISMYVSYIPQLIANFSGQPVNPIQPLVAGINATLWVIYGLIQDTKDWPLVISNFPGIIFGLLTALTVYVH
ncbi:SWEET family sugar transporter [Periweissella ghanensis]|uniref:Sugar efflux transporter for intercellular exchange n=1 Tax=Periweissella ghanensis TaxID=467997 RepID=A0ABM8Z9C6_9LACO|nr:SWEET family sugar transporter [Periweissella ghanensis]MCM0600462.1 hypothetical protein [Periweissella ghanensis]CAH0418072.1 hypothetical protein WGH24286_00488 [Periweissella ghanensis]